MMKIDWKKTVCETGMVSGLALMSGGVAAGVLDVLPGGVSILAIGTGAVIGTAGELALQRSGYNSFGQRKPRGGPWDPKP